MSQGTNTGLSQKVFNSSAWMMGGQWLNRIIGFTSTVILARLLTPEDYGICAMAALIMSFIEIVTLLGGERYLIKKQDADAHDYNTAWTIRFIQFVGISVLLWLLAPQAADYLDEPRLVQVLYIFALAGFISAFENIWMIRLRKNLEFSKVFLFGLCVKVAGFVTTVTLAILYQNYWAMVFGFLILRGSATVLSYLIEPTRPRFSLNRIREQWAFSQWILVSNLAVYMRNKADQLIVSKYFGSSGIGLYTMSSEIANLPTTDVTLPASQAIFPGLSKLAHDPMQFASAYLQVLGVLATILLPMAMGMAYTSEDIVLIVLGEQWLGTVGIIQIIAVFGIAFAFSFAASDILTILGQVKIISFLNWGLVSALVPLLLFAAAQGASLEDIAVLRAAVAWAVLPVYYWLVVRYTTIRVSELFASILRPIVATAAMLTVLTGLDPYLILGRYPHFILILLTGVLSYSGTLMTLWYLSGQPASGEKLLFDKLLGRVFPRRPPLPQRPS